MVTPAKRRFARKAERGTTVLVVVMVTTLITAIGVFAVRNISQIDQAVGYSRQAGQTNALAELGATATLAQIGVKGTEYTDKMDTTDTNDKTHWCLANGPFYQTLGSSCFRLKQPDIEATTTGASGETLLEPAVPGTETGSFGPLANTTGSVYSELTEKYQTSTAIAGIVQGSGTFYDVTVTTMANVRPITTSTDPCGDNVAATTIKKVLRVHTIAPGHPVTSPGGT